MTLPLLPHYPLSIINCSIVPGGRGGLWDILGTDETFSVANLENRSRFCDCILPRIFHHGWHGYRGYSMLGITYGLFPAFPTVGILLIPVSEPY